MGHNAVVGMDNWASSIESHNCVTLRLRVRFILPIKKKKRIIKLASSCKMGWLLLEDTITLFITGRWIQADSYIFHMGLLWCELKALNWGPFNRECMLSNDTFSDTAFVCTYHPLTQTMNNVKKLLAACSFRY